MPLNIRTYTWLKNGLSWSYVLSRLMESFTKMGHRSLICSTNGIGDNKEFINDTKLLESAIALQNFGPGKQALDIDLTYTVPSNFPQRFLANSKAKCAIYNYETTYWPAEWKKFYHLADYYFPSSNFSAEIFHINGVPKEKIFVIPHGVDTSVFNSSIPKIKLKTEKRFKFIAVCEPHARKNLELLLTAYCEAFSAKDDVCFVLKTKIYKHSDGMYDAQKNPKGRKAFEIVLGDIFKKLHDKFGKDIPEIEVLGGFVDNVSSIYNAAHCNITVTGAEGFYMPGLESMACGLLNVAPNYSGHLDYLNSNNSLLIDSSLRNASATEQYWGFNKKSQIGQASKEHTIATMIKAYKEYDVLIEKFKPQMEETVRIFSWDNAAKMILDATNGKMEHYIPGTYNVWPK